MNKDITLRTRFNSEARLYNLIRPRYPKTLFDALVGVTNLKDDDNLLEIGVGTGQATEELAKRGCKITAVELGAELAEVARDELNKYKNVEVITGAFEDVEFSPKTFDLVYAATAFHWIKHEVRFSKPHKLLKQDGYLAIIHTNHVSDETGDEFFFASQPLYRKYKLADNDDSFRLPLIADLQAEKLDENLFKLIFFNAFPLLVHYNSDEYAQLIKTYSPILAMKPSLREGFLKEISQLIERQFGGSLLKLYAMTLTIAKRKS
jgi:ubiquinone/menaquinone biosynthesis C-methylase UbiE